MRILGVDPGMTRCGVGVIDAASIRAVQLVDVGVIRTASGLDPALRLLKVEEGLESWVTRCRPDAVAVERVFAQHNLTTVTGTAQVAGIAMLVSARHGIPVTLHTPSEVKAAITGSGSSGKAQVGAMVLRILKLKEVPKPADAADALALALCHLWRAGTVNRYAALANEHAAKAEKR